MERETPIRYFEVKDGKVLSLVGQISEAVYENREDVIDKRLYDIPSISESSASKLANELSMKDKRWINELFTVKFIYWAKKGILGVTGVAAEIEGFGVPSNIESPANNIGTLDEDCETIIINTLNSFDKIKAVEKLVHDYIYREQLRRELK